MTSPQPASFTTSSAEHTQFVKNSVQYATVALLSYDYSLTWMREVNYVWRQKFTLSTALYIVCRYSMITNVIYSLVTKGMFPILSCDQGYKVCSSLGILTRGAILVVWGARTSAVYNNNKYILMIFGTMIALISILDIIRVPYVVCKGNPGDPIIETFLASLVVFYELLVAILTATRSWNALRAGGFWREKTSLVDLIIRDGLLYFISASFLTVGTLVLLHTASTGSIFQRLLNPFTLPVSGLVTARFILHLREYEHRRTFGSVIDEGYCSSIHFEENIKQLSTGSGIMAQFGEDPVLRARREADTIPNIQSCSTAEGSGLSGGGGGGTEGIQRRLSVEATLA